MLEYLGKQHGWSKMIFEMIEWEGIDGLMKQANPIKRIQLLKMLHNWQNIGQQKGRMRDSKLKMDTENPTELTFEVVNCHLCPSGCDEEDRELHYLHCPKATVINVREDLIRTVLKN